MRRTSPTSIVVTGGVAGLLAVSALAVAPSATAVVVSPQVSLAAACDASIFDANGDGVTDLVAGVPGENVGKSKKGVNAGTVTVTYGGYRFSPYGRDGSRVIKAETVGQDSERNDRFGSSVLVADLNGDDCQDLVIGMPGENRGKGRVVVMWGSPAGLAGHQILDQDKKGVPGKAERGDAFGAALAVTGHGGGSLWISSPGEDVGKVGNAGLITQFPFGSGGGSLPSSGITNYSEKSGGVPGSVKAGDRFGSVLLGTNSALYVGVPRQRVQGAGSAGAVYRFNSDWTFFAQGVGAPGKLERGDRFGAALAVMTCPGATGQTLVVGSPGENVGKLKDAGTITVINGSSQAVIKQDSSGVPNKDEKNDLFGRSLVGLGDAVAVGVPQENFGGKKNAGLVTQLAMDCSGTPVVTSAKVLKALNVNSGDRFGLVLASGYAPAEGGTNDRATVIVGSPQEGGAGAPDMGTVAVFDDPDSAGLFTHHASLVSQVQVKGKPEKKDFFGAAVAAAQ